jgi:hypothetical protein
MSWAYHVLCMCWGWAAHLLGWSLPGLGKPLQRSYRRLIATAIMALWTPPCMSGTMAINPPPYLTVIMAIRMPPYKTGILAKSTPQ